ncbi:hypothetical protein LWI29_002812 [Acer saccharum]|uniref:Uncharacterized protein n=1 Tax=Acer saccharum TaxID=4024 RepID=A0AA39VUB0_ACESA|nr:hypothetical protein LWI29_002812 [Acer saccharum]
MAEVYTNGPVEVAFTVYEDFAHYKSGVYKHITGDIMGGHAVKLIGGELVLMGLIIGFLLISGTKAGEMYDGYFKIRRATNECGIEEDVVAGFNHQKVNENPKAGWEAARNPRFSNYTVGEFKYLLGVKPTPEKELLGIPVVTHDKSLKLPDSFDARTAWPKCSNIGRILGQVIAVLVGLLVLLNRYDRFCIHFDMNISLSVNDLLACCGFWCGSGCNGVFRFMLGDTLSTMVLSLKSVILTLMILAAPTRVVNLDILHQNV